MPKKYAFDDYGVKYETLDKDEILASIKSGDLKEDTFSGSVEFEGKIIAFDYCGTLPSDNILRKLLNAGVYYQERQLAESEVLGILALPDFSINFYYIDTNLYVTNSNDQCITFVKGGIGRMDVYPTKSDVGYYMKSNRKMNNILHVTKEEFDHLIKDPNTLYIVDDDEYTQNIVLDFKFNYIKAGSYSLVSFPSNLTEQLNSAPLDRFVCKAEISVTLASYTYTNTYYLRFKSLNISPTPDFSETYADYTFSSNDFVLRMETLQGASIGQGDIVFEEAYDSKPNIDKLKSDVTTLNDHAQTDIGISSEHDWSSNAIARPGLYAVNFLHDPRGKGSGQTGTLMLSVTDLNNSVSAKSGFYSIVDENELALHYMYTATYSSVSKSITVTQHRIKSVSVSYTRTSALVEAVTGTADVTYKGEILGSGQDYPYATLSSVRLITAY